MRESVDDLSWIGVRLGGRVVNNLHYADDIVLIVQSPQALQLLDKVQSVSKEYGLDISQENNTHIHTHPFYGPLDFVQDGCH